MLQGCITFLLLLTEHCQGEERLPEMADSQIFFCSCPFTLCSCVFFLWFQPFFPFSIFFFPWHCELPLCVTVTWASASPHITAAFDWLGLSRSVSCCLIITLFDCWSRDVIDWSAHPVWACASDGALCVWVCIEVGGFGWLLHRVPDKHTCTCVHAYLHSRRRMRDPTHIYPLCYGSINIYSWGNGEQRWKKKKKSRGNLFFQPSPARLSFTSH